MNDIHLHASPPVHHPLVPVVHLAEDVLPGHPDRLADAVAESLVDRAVSHDPEALVGVEVAVHREAVFVTGRIAAGPVDQPLSLDLPAIVAEVCARAGYSGPWQLVSEVVADLDLGPLAADERGIRGFSDDQDIVVGHATGTEARGFLPPAVAAVRRLRAALSDLRGRHPDRLGPDGKVLVHLSEQDGRFRWERCNLALQHVEGVSYEELYRLVLPLLETEAAALDLALPGLGESWDPDRVRLNGAGDFSRGGPRGDNGLSGKKLVVDHYGPGVPIGGGALCGKDPHKVDRVGALCARQLAVRLVRDAGAGEASVLLGYLPGLAAPDFLAARVYGEWWDRDRLSRTIPVPDLSIASAFARFELDAIRWSEVLSRGYFGNQWPWE